MLTPANPSGLPVRRRWGRLALGIGLVVFWVWGTLAVVVTAGDHDEVVAVAAGVDRFELIEQSDLKIVQVGTVGDVDTVPAGDLDDLVGRVAAVDLVSGSLLAPDELVPEGDRVVGAGEAVVGARLRPGEFPPEGVHVGSGILVVVRPAQVAAGGASGVSEVGGWLLSVGDADETTGETSFSVVVPRSDAPTVTAAAADGRVSLVMVGT